MVKRVDDGGRLAVSKVGGSFPWVWGEGPVDVLGDRDQLTGVLSFGSRHISDESPNKEQTEKAVRWRDAWVETMLDDDGAGRSRGAPRHRGWCRPRIASGRCGWGPKGSTSPRMRSTTRARWPGCSIWPRRLTEPPRCDVELVFTSREEIGCVGASFYTGRTVASSLIALEVTPVAKEYKITLGPDPVLIAADSYGPLHDLLGRELAESASAAGLTMQHAVVSNFGSDASSALRAGNVARTACLAFATENTHGFEIAHLDGITNCVTVLERWLA